MRAAGAYKFVRYILLSLMHAALPPVRSLFPDSAADKAAIPSTFNPQRGAFELSSTSLFGPWVLFPGNDTAGRAVAWNGAVATEALGWVATGDMAAGLSNVTERRYYYTAFSTIASPPGWVAPTHSGLEPGVMALSVMVRTR